MVRITVRVPRNYAAEYPDTELKAVAMAVERIAFHEVYSADDPAFLRSWSPLVEVLRERPAGEPESAWHKVPNWMKWRTYRGRLPGVRPSERALGGIVARPPDPDAHSKRRR